MADAPPAPKKPAAAAVADDKLKELVKTTSKEDLLKEIQALQLENKSLLGQISSAASANATGELKQENEQLKKTLADLNNEMLKLLKTRKKEFDADTLNQTLTVLKDEALLMTQAEQATGEKPPAEAPPAPKK